MCDLHVTHQLSRWTLYTDCCLWCCDCIPNSVATVTMLRALYEYTGEDDEELTFPEGAEIQLVHTDEGVDDGFWKGRYEGCVGLFPSVVVEVISNGLVSCTLWYACDPQACWFQLGIYALPDML